MKRNLVLGLIILLFAFSSSNAQETSSQALSLEYKISQLKSQLDICRSDYKQKSAQSKAKLEKEKKAAYSH